jgi:hypothetical protein
MLKMQALFVISFLWLSRLPLFPLKFCFVFVGSQHASFSMMNNVVRKMQENNLRSTILQHAEPKTREKVYYFGFQVFEAINDCLFVSAPVATNMFF